SSSIGTRDRLRPARARDRWDWTAAPDGPWARAGRRSSPLARRPTDPVAARPRTVRLRRSARTRSRAPRDELERTWCSREMCAWLTEQCLIAVSQRLDQLMLE